jgi:hypothetical protein
MAKLLHAVYMALACNRAVRVLNCFFWGLAGFAMSAIYALTGLNRAPRFFSPWQREALCFYPPVEYPLRSESSPAVPLSRLDSRGMFTGAAVFHRVPASALRNLLDPGLKLDDALVSAGGEYPVAYLFGYQQDLRQMWTRKGGVNYLEFAFAIPGVELADSDTTGYRGPFLYLPRLFLNRLYPTVLGLLAFYPKRWARIETMETSFIVKSLIGGRPLLRARFGPAGPPGAPSDFSEFAAWRKLLNRPHINRFSRGRFVLVDYFWGWNHCLIEELRGVVEVFEDSIPGMQKGVFSDCVAFQIAAPFEWIPPFRSDEINAKR